MNVCCQKLFAVINNRILFNNHSFFFQLQLFDDVKINAN